MSSNFPICSESAEIKRALGIYLQEHFNLKKDPTSFGITQTTISARRKAFDLYLRVCINALYSFPARSIVIARIGFDKPQSGHGTSLINFLTDLGQYLDFKYMMSSVV